jgi:DNA-binding MarR family transcriptional regulator
MNTKGERDDELVLELLDAIGKQNDLSQRHLARHLGVALGLANSYLKRCTRKGYVKIRTAPANRYLYYLTPKGFAEKSRLTAKYLSYSFAFYRRASASCAEVFQQCAARGWKRVVLCGISDLAEIASLQATEAQIEVVAIYDPHADRERFVGKKVWTDLNGIETFDVCVLTDLLSPSASHKQLIERVGQERVMVPDILRLE